MEKLLLLQHDFSKASAVDTSTYTSASVKGLKHSFQVPNKAVSVDNGTTPGGETDDPTYQVSTFRGPR